MKSAGGDKQYVVGLDRAVLGVDCAAFDDGQDVSLHPFP